LDLQVLDIYRCGLYGLFGLDIPEV
jgi:hypothetical protein